MKTSTLLAMGFLIAAPLSVSAASISFSNYDGEHYHSGGNVGPNYLATTVEDRTDAITLSPNGVVSGSETDAYAGAIPNVAGVRLGRAETTSDTLGLLAEDGFLFRSIVTAEAECTQKSGVSFGCSPFMGNQATVSFEFMVDMDSTLFLDGSWFGGNGNESLVSVVDFLGLNIQRDTGFIFQNIFAVDTNTFNRNEANGLFEGSVELTAGTTYRFNFNHRTAVQAPDAEGVVVNDTSSILFAASIIQENANASTLDARIDALDIAPVPLPAAGWLLLASIGAMGALRRRRD